MPARIIGTNHPDADPQYERLLKRIMTAIDSGDTGLFWGELEKLRDYTAMKKIIKEKTK